LRHNSGEFFLLLWSWRCGHCSPSVCQLHSASPFAVTLRVDNPSFHVAARFIDQLHPPLERNPHSGHTGGRTLFRHRSRPLALLMTLVGWWQWMPSGCRLHSCSWRYQCAPCRSAAVSSSSPRERPLFAGVLPCHLLAWQPLRPR